MNLDAVGSRDGIPISPVSRLRYPGGTKPTAMFAIKLHSHSAPFAGFVRVPSFWLFAQEVTDGRRQLVRMLEKQAHLPNLRISEAVAKTRHAGQPDAVLRLPIGFPRRIVGDTRLVQTDKRRWLGIHSQGDRRGWPIRRAVTDHALCVVNLSTGGEVSLGRFDWRGLVCFSVDRRVERNASEKSLEWQRLPLGGHRHSARFDKEEGGQRNYAKTNDDS